MTSRLRGTLLAVLLALLASFIVFAIIRALQTPNDAASWLQVAVEAFALPVVLYELVRIRNALEAKPDLVVGLASVEDLPLAKIADLETLTKSISIDRGYAFFMLVVRNRGDAIANSVKIHFEYLPPKHRRLLTPTIKTYEFQERKAHGFSQENNVDFVFSGGSDWFIHPHDTEAFGFFMTTVLVIQKEPHEIRERPEPGTYEFACTIRAEGLSHPIRERLMVEIVEKPDAA